MGGHSDGVKRKKFCALRKKKCPCGHRYRTVCIPGWANLGYQAHHLLCVACVTEFIGKNKSIVEVVRKTKWCINTSMNMLAMPMSGMTIKWYCGLAIKGKPLTAPLFSGLPQHDYDHGLYNQELNRELEALAQEIKDELDQHREPDEGALAGTLDSMSKAYLRKLKQRGSVRSGGTHQAWINGSTKQSKTWYKAFSMAEAPTARSFPVPGFDAKAAATIRRSARTFAGLKPTN